MTHHYDNCTRVTLVTKGQYVGGLRVCTFFLSNYGLVIHISQRVVIVRLYKGQLALHVVCWQRCCQDEAVDDFRPR